MAFPPNRPSPIFNDMPPDLAQFRTHLHGVANTDANSSSNGNMPTTCTYVVAHRTAKARERPLPTITADYGEKRPTKGLQLKSVKRKRSSRTPIGCPCKIKTGEHAGMLLIEKSSPENHNHEYSALESKMPSAI
jgi:hypothetical protein